MSEYVVDYEQCEEGGGVPTSPTFRVSSRWARTRFEVAERIQEALVAYASDTRERGESLPTPHHAAGTVAA